MKNPSIVVRAAVPTAIAGAVVAVVGFAARGSSGAIGGLVGALLVLVFFALGQWVLHRVIATNPQAAMSVAMVMYLVKIGVLFLLLVVFQNTTLFDTKVFAGAIVACTLVWLAAETWAYATTKVLYVDPERPPFEDRH